MMYVIIIALVLIIAAFISGALVYRNNSARIEKLIKEQIQELKDEISKLKDIINAKKA